MCERKERKAVGMGIAAACFYASKICFLRMNVVSTRAELFAQAPSAMAPRVGFILEFYRQCFKPRTVLNKLVVLLFGSVRLASCAHLCVCVFVCLCASSCYSVTCLTTLTCFRPKLTAQ